MKLSINYIILILTILLISCGKVDRTKAPKPDTPEPFKMGKMESFKLNNGTTVYLVHRPKNPRFFISVNITHPDIYKDEKSAERNVLSSLYYKNLDIDTYSNEEIKKLFKLYGIESGATIGGGFVRGLTRHLEKALPIVIDQIYNPIITQELFDKELKSQIEASKNPYKREEGKFNSNSLVDSLVYGNKKGDEPKQEVKPNFKGLNLAKLQEFKKERLGGLNTSIMLIGDFTKKSVSALFNKYLTNVGKGKKIVNKISLEEYKPLIKKRMIMVVDNKKSAQTKVSFKWHMGKANRYFDNHNVVEVVNDIFGGSQMSYLYRNIREDKGLTYSIVSSLNPDQGGGIGSVFTRVKKGTVVTAVENILKEMNKIRNQEVSDEDLRIAKNSIIGKHTRSLAGGSTTPYISFSMQKGLYDLPDDYLQTKVSKVFKINKKQVKEVANKYIHPDKCLIIVEGDVDKIKGKLEQFGQVEYLDENGKLMKF